MSTKKTGMETHTKRLLITALSVVGVGCSSSEYPEGTDFCQVLIEAAGPAAAITIDNGVERKMKPEECLKELKIRENNAVAALIQSPEKMLDKNTIKEKEDKAAEQRDEIEAQAKKGTAELTAFSCAKDPNSLALCGGEWVKDIYVQPEPKPKAACALVSAIALNGSKDAVIAVGERGHILKASISDLNAKGEKAFDLEKICTVERDERETKEWRDTYGPTGDVIGEKVASMKAAAAEEGVPYSGESMKNDPDYPYYRDGEVPSVWKQIVNIENGTRVALNDVFFIEGTKVGYIVGYDGVVLKTEDDGDSWTLIYSQPPENNDVPETNFFGVYFRNVDQGWAVGSRGNIHSTTDGGKTWTKATLPAGDAEIAQYNSIERLEDGSLYATGNDGFMLRSSDLGKTWVLHTTLTMESLISFCHDTYQFAVNKETYQCKECKSFETRDVKNGDCNRTCPAGQAKNDAGQCQVMECESGEWSDDEQRCVVTCAAGEIYNEFEESCVSTSCDEGMVWNSEDLECAEPTECEEDTVAHPLNPFDDCVDPSEVAEIIATAKEEAAEAEAEANEEQKVARYIGAVFGQVPLSQTRVLVHSMSGSAFVTGNLNPSAAGASNQEIINNWRRFQIPTSVSFFGGTRLRNGEVVLVGSKGIVVVSSNNVQTFSMLPKPIEGEPDLIDVIEHPTKDGLLILVGDGGPYRHQL